jgi:outer membrane protein OmpA-like peptidoglycan-associated protein
MNLYYTIEFNRPKDIGKYTFYLKACNPMCDTCSTEFMRVNWENNFKDISLKEIDLTQEDLFPVFGSDKKDVITKEELETLKSTTSKTTIIQNTRNEDVNSLKKKTNIIELNQLEEEFSHVKLPVFEFVLNSDEFSQKYDNEIDSILHFLNKHPQLRLKIIGHTDNQGDSKSNLELSKIRAIRVKKILIEHAIDPSRIETEGHGETDPLYENDSDLHRSLNRRIEFEIME